MSSKFTPPASSSKFFSYIQGSINPEEAAYVLSKTKNSLADWTAYLKNVNLEGLDVSTFVPSSANAKPAVTVPNIGFAISGGGERAMLVGGGLLAALDGRNATAVAAKTGGILQLAQYLAGTSGGGWLTSSYSVNNAPTFECKQSLLELYSFLENAHSIRGSIFSDFSFRLSNSALRDTVWDFEEMLFGPQVAQPLEYEDAINSTVEKAAAGYPVSIVDPCKLQL